MFHVSFPGLGINDLPVNRVAFSIGSFNVYWYGILIATGLMLAVLYAYFNAHRYDVDRNKLIDCVIVGIITAVIGARAYYVAFRWDYFSAHPAEIIDIRDGGIAIYGSIIGALIGGLVVAKIRKMKFLPVLDITMTGFLIGQAIGRWGNFFNQEAYGTPTDSIFRMGLFNTRTGAWEFYHPTFLYESVWNALGFVLLHFLSKHRKYDGQVALGYAAWYGLGRAFIEGLRVDSLYWGSFRVSQLLAAASCVAAVAVLVYFHFHKRNGKTLFVNRSGADA